MEIYVDSSAEGVGDGTQTRPFKSLAAANRTAKSGDRVIVTGIFREAIELRTAGVVWIASDEGAVLDGRYPRYEQQASGKAPVMPAPDKFIPGAEYSKMVEFDAAGVVFDGFTIQNVAGQPVGFTKQADGAKLINCTIDGAYGGGIVADDCSDILVENTTMRRCNLKRFDPSNKGGGDAHVQVNLLFKNVTNGAIRDCEVSENWGEGIGLARGSRGCVVEDCKVWNNLHMHIVFNSAQACIARNNFIYHTGDIDFCQSKSKRPPDGIVFADEKQGAGKHDLPPASGNKVYGNVVVGMSTNLLTRESDNSNGDLVDTDIYNNTFVNAVGKDGANVVIRPAAHRNSHFYNNIIIQDKGEIAILPGGQGVAIGNNVWSKKPANGGADDVVGEVYLANHTAALDENASRDNYAPTAASKLVIGKATGGKDIGAIPYKGTTPEPPVEPPVVDPAGETAPVADWLAELSAVVGQGQALIEKMQAFIERQQQDND